jgi:N-glycosylase/DNA lyase
LNLFLRDVLYNRYLSDHLDFFRIEAWLEVPLDSYVADGLTRASLRAIPKWRGVKYVSAPESEQFQRAAREIAQAHGIAPVHLDIYWWRGVGKLRASALNPASQQTRRRKARTRPVIRG